MITVTDDEIAEYHRRMAENLISLCTFMDEATKANLIANFSLGLDDQGNCIIKTLEITRKP